MIGYITLGTNNLERAVNFFDELLTVIDAKRFMEVEGHFVAWAAVPGFHNLLLIIVSPPKLYLLPAALCGQPRHPSQAVFCRSDPSCREWSRSAAG